MKAPFGFSRHWIDGDSAKKLHLFALNINSVDEGFQIRRIVLAVYLGLDCTPVRCILVVIDGVAHLPEVTAEFAFMIPFDLESGDGYSGRCEDRQNRRRDNQFDQ